MIESRLDAKIERMNLKFREEIINEWEDISVFYQSFQTGCTKWIFRGQGKSDYHLQTSLERAADDYGLGANERPGIEDNLLRAFKRRAHHYLSSPPGETDTLEWWSLMQHHGAPTRLLDWTYSFFVAIFFAVENGHDEAAVWALDFNWCQEAAESLFPADVKKYSQRDPIMHGSKYIDSFFRKNRRRLVYAINPERLNQRLILQQGLFLCPGDIKASFEANFSSMQSKERSTEHLIKFRIAKGVELRRTLIKNLASMNMSRATLFPGIDGFAQSLRTQCATPEVLKPRHFGQKLRR